MMSKHYLADLAERVITAFLAAFAATFLASIDNLSKENLVSVAGKAGIAGLAAAVVLVKGLFAHPFGDTDTASLSPAAKTAVSLPEPVVPWPALGTHPATGGLVAPTVASVNGGLTLSTAAYTKPTLPESPSAPTASA